MTADQEWRNGAFGPIRGRPRNGHGQHDPAGVERNTVAVIDADFAPGGNPSLDLGVGAPQLLTMQVERERKLSPNFSFLLHKVPPKSG